MKKILIATHNPAKVIEIKHGLSNISKLGFEIISLKELNIKDKIDETGKTFEENAFLKAKYYADLTSFPTIADDGGVAIEALKGEPGVKSRMWLGYEVTDEELIKHTLKELKGKKLKDRKAYLETCLCFYDPKTKKKILEIERINGYIAEKASKERMEGYPFRSLFLIDVDGKLHYYDGLSNKKQQLINHRLLAVSRLVPKIKAHLIK